MPEAAIRNSIVFDDLTLHYQPQVSADGARIVAVEALLRVLRPTPRLVTPADVLTLFSAPAAEEALDWWVLRRACSDARGWPSLTVSVNVVAARFHDPHFADRLLEMLAEVGLDPHRLELEIVEGAYIEDFDSALANINALRARGVRIAIDDFGTGYSSLTYLLKIPVDKLKIDKSFVAGVGLMRSAAIVHAVIALARALGLKITAEGVETDEQHRFLRAAGCHFLQGWLFSKAVPAETISAMVESGQPPRRSVA